MIESGRVCASYRQLSGALTVTAFLSIALSAHLARAAEPSAVPHRLLILTPRGPLVVDVVLLNDGVPLRRSWDQTLDGILHAAEREKKGPLRWDDALADPRFFLGRHHRGYRASLRSTAEDRDLFDADRNGTVERDEFLRYAEAVTGGELRLAENSASAGTVFPGFLAPLDVDGDGMLSADEIAAAPERLLGFDADRSETLRHDEPYEASRWQIASDWRKVPAERSVLLLDSETTWDAIFSRMSIRYARGKPVTRLHWPLTSRLLSRLDLNLNNQLDSHEVPFLARTAAHARIEVDLGAAADSHNAVTLHYVAPELGRRETLIRPVPRGLELRLEGAILLIDAGSNVEDDSRFAADARTVLAREDADRNGMLSGDELRSMHFAWTDLDGDGRADQAELAEAFRRDHQAGQSRVRAVLAERAHSFFTALDENFDGLLGTRELRNAADTLSQLDLDGDGRLSSDEAPVFVHLAFYRGEFNNVLPRQSRRWPLGRRLADASTPEWFLRMDRNGDGDLSSREFLGTPEQFTTLDSDADGLIDPHEAGSSLTRPPLPR